MINYTSMDAKDKILKSFETSQTALKTGEIAKITGIDSKLVSKYIKELKKEGKIYSPKRCYYDINKS